MAFSDGIADFRSDTVTRPTQEMRQAMAVAEVGDDVYGEDPTVNILEKEAAAAVGKEEALFVPSGTMSNQLALGTQTSPGSEVVCAEAAHIRDSEVGAGAALWGVQFRTVAGTTGAISRDQLEPLIGRHGSHVPRISLLAWENTHNASGGTVLDPSLMQETSARAREASWAIHLDGARIFNAAVALETSAIECAAVADTVNFCFSKGLGAPIGSVLCGPVELISEARLLRRRLGGGMRQAGVAAAAARVALRSWERLAIDHELAQALARGLAERVDGALDPARVQTNMVLLPQTGTPFSLSALVAAAEAEGVKVAPPSGGRIRFVTHRDVDQADVDRLLGVIDTLAAG